MSFDTKKFFEIAGVDPGTGKARQVVEAMNNRRFDKGQVKFNKSNLSDPEIITLMGKISQATGRSISEIQQVVLTDLAKQQPLADAAPLLYHTIKENFVEGALFTFFQKAETQVPSAPKFSNLTFQKLIRSIKAEHDEFFPLRGFIDRRRLENPSIQYVGKNTDAATKYQGVPTAAATPSGEFIFNVDFMQKLLEYAHLKGIKPKGKKYTGNGGDIPDEYGYLEFLILHEFMHYTHEDFYYQKIIPNANPTIINWVGDFRTNYLLVKSGYEQLPIGLYNDLINYDRQNQYIDMYRKVLEEFEKLKEDGDDSGDGDGQGEQGEDGEQSDGDQGQSQQSGGKPGKQKPGKGKGKVSKEQIERDLNARADDHEPGTEEGEEADVDASTDDIDEAGQKVEKDIKEGKDLSPQERDQKVPPGQTRPDAGKQLDKRNGNPRDVDYKSIKPTFNWKELIARFLKNAKPRSEETYSRPHRRSVTGTHVATQVGAAAIKPAERPAVFSDAKIGFCFDSSGSMSETIKYAYSNALNLLRTPAYQQVETTVFRFSDAHEIFKCNFATDRAAAVTNIKDKPARYDLKTSAIFLQHIGGGTQFTPALAGQMIEGLNQGYNTICFLDSDIMWAENLENFTRVIKAKPQQVFVIFDHRNTYVNFRQKTGIATANITYFRDT